MEKRIKVLAIVAVAVIAIIAIFANLWLDARGERNELRDQVAMLRAEAVIIGQAYVDSYIVGSLDEFDYPATGFQVKIYRRVPGRNDVLVGLSMVDEYGKYKFSIMEPGEYYVQPVTMIPGYPGWNVVPLKSPGMIFIGEGGTYPGPIFLLSQYGGLG